MNVNACLTNLSSAYGIAVWYAPYNLRPVLYDVTRSIISFKHEIFSIVVGEFPRNQNFSFALILSKLLLHWMSLNKHVTQKSIAGMTMNTTNLTTAILSNPLRHPNYFFLGGVKHCLGLKRHHYSTIPRFPCSSKSRFVLVYWLHTLTVSTFLYIRASYENASPEIHLLGGIPAC